MFGRGGAPPSKFAIEVMRLRWSREPELPPGDIWRALRPELKVGREPADVALAMSEMERGLAAFQKAEVSGKMVLITGGEHAMQLGRVVGPKYSATVAGPPLFTKSHFVARREVVDVKLVRKGVLVLRVPFDDVVLQEEGGRPCCFGAECIGTGTYLLGEASDPVRDDDECCAVCFHARVRPARMLAGPAVPPSEGAGHISVL